MSVFFKLIVGTHPCKDCKIVKNEEKNFNDVQICPVCRAKEEAERDALSALTLDQFIREVVNGRAELVDSSNHYQSLYERYLQDMPYGTAKARDGDPYEWITNQLMGDHEEMIEAEA